MFQTRQNCHGNLHVKGLAFGEKLVELKYSGGFNSSKVKCLCWRCWMFRALFFNIDGITHY